MQFANHGFKRHAFKLETALTLLTSLSFLPNPLA